MKYFIGWCSKCGGDMFWSSDEGKCIFHSVGGCLCECLYPKQFMEWWDEHSCPYNINTFFSAWENSQQQIKVACEKLEELIKTGSELVFSRNKKWMVCDKNWEATTSKTIFGLLEKLA